MPASSDSPYFEVRQSSIQGRGGFAVKPIRKGTRIIEYTGERISQREADKRYDDASMRRHHTFLFSLDSGKVIDAAVGGNDARYINHSCDPNCEAIEEAGRIFIEAIRPIKAGDELYYDYAYERSSATTPEDEKLYECRCGSPKCRGSILAPEQPKKKRQAASKSKSKKKAGAKKKSGSRSKTKSAPKTKSKSKSKGKAKKKSARR
jgi:SET domain-containing protein